MNELRRNTKNQCECGADVSADFFRLFSIDGTLHACQECENRVGNDYTP